MITYLEMLPFLLEHDGTVTPFGSLPCLARLYVALLLILLSRHLFALGSFDTLSTLLSYLLLYASPTGEASHAAVEVGGSTP
jgi:hypothetical protein